MSAIISRRLFARSFCPAPSEAASPPHVNFMALGYTLPPHHNNSNNIIVNDIALTRVIFFVLMTHGDASVAKCISEVTGSCTHL